MMMMQNMNLELIGKRPMLAYTGSEEIFAQKLKEGPLMASFKLDGIRLRLLGQRLTTGRDGKTAPNTWMRKTLESPLTNFLDGEAIAFVGNSDRLLTFNENQSLIMSEGGTPNYQFCVFDTCNPKYSNVPFAHREAIVGAQVKAAQKSGFTQLTFWKSDLIHNMEELLKYEQLALEAGYEGLIVRSPEGKYKYGRSTVKEGIMGKLKRFEDREAIIDGFEMLRHNENEAVRNELGYQKRSHHQAGKRESTQYVGKVLAHDLLRPEWTFKVGSGFDFELRADMCQHPQKYLGKQFTYKFQPHGTKDAPRIPVWKGLRLPNT
jgi:DNA ligase-1